MISWLVQEVRAGVRVSALRTFRSLTSSEAGTRIPLLMVNIACVTMERPSHLAAVTNHNFDGGIPSVRISFWQKSLDKCNFHGEHKLKRT